MAAFLHKDSTNGEIQGISLDFEWLYVIRKSEDAFL